MWVKDPFVVESEGLMLGGILESPYLDCRSGPEKQRELRRIFRTPFSLYANFDRRAHSQSLHVVECCLALNDPSVLNIFPFIC